MTPLRAAERMAQSVPECEMLGPITRDGSDVSFIIGIGGEPYLVSLEPIEEDED